jgi:hypothetical protein
LDIESVPSFPSVPSVPSVPLDPVLGAFASCLHPPELEDRVPAQGPSSFGLDGHVDLFQKIEQSHVYDYNIS